MVRFEHRSGFTLVELMIVIVIIGILAALFIPMATGHVNHARNAAAMEDVRTLEKEITQHLAAHNEYPATLAEIGRGDFLDPWENRYEYLRIAGEDKMPVGMRKDHFLVPVNSDFDLYSKGEDGETIAPFAAPAAKDDIVRANNGSFVGLANNF